MTIPPLIASALPGTFPPKNGGPNCAVFFHGRRVDVPLIQTIANYAQEYWPPDEASNVQTACGLSWNWTDIRRFLNFCQPAFNHRGEPHLIWTGATSKGKGNHQLYSSFHTKGKTVRAYKFYAVAVLGLRPEPGQHLDHDCDETLCVTDIQILSKRDNELKIRRPNKAVLDGAKALNVTPAEYMNLKGNHSDPR